MALFETALRAGNDAGGELQYTQRRELRHRVGLLHTTVKRQTGRLRHARGAQQAISVHQAIRQTYTR